MAAFVGESKNAIVAATLPTLGHWLWSALGMACRFAGVSMMDGTMALTKIASAASSSPNDCVMDATAAFEAL